MKRFKGVEFRKLLDILFDMEEDKQELPSIKSVYRKETLRV